MNNEELLRAFDMITGVVIALNNQSTRDTLNDDFMVMVEEIRELIKARKKNNGN